MAASVGATPNRRDRSGSIVRDAHLPVYKRLGFSVAGIFDANPKVTAERAAAFAIPRVFESIDEAATTRGAIFDVAIPPENIAGVLERLPSGAAVLIQNRSAATWPTPFG